MRPQLATSFPRTGHRLGVALALAAGAILACSEPGAPSPTRGSERYGVLTVDETGAGRYRVGAQFVRADGVDADRVELLLGERGLFGTDLPIGTCEIVDRAARLAPLIADVDLDVQLLDAGELELGDGTSSLLKVRPAPHPDRLPFVAGAVYGPAALESTAVRVRVGSRGGEEVGPFTVEADVVGARGRWVDASGDEVAASVSGSQCAGSAAMHVGRREPLEVGYSLEGLVGREETAIAELRVGQGDAVACRLAGPSGTLRIPAELVQRLPPGSAELVLTVLRRTSFGVRGLDRAELRVRRAECLPVQLDG